MSTASTINAQRKRSGLPLIRFNVRKLMPADIMDLREAFAAMMEISDTAEGDSRGYWALARGHGYDQFLCHNDERIFLTWHRAYIYYFEKALSTALQWKRNDPNLVLTLPYWDWTKFDAATDAPSGIPRIFDDSTYLAASGQQQPNPLYSARSLYRISGLAPGLVGNQQFTSRYPNKLRAIIPQLAADVVTLDGISDFADFSMALDQGAHGTVHNYTGGGDPQSPLLHKNGDMSEIISAAYDPIFWVHHAMVDKVWFDWQGKYGNSSVPQQVLDAVGYGNMTGREVLDAEKSLLYIYSDQDIQSADIRFPTVQFKPERTPIGDPAERDVVGRAAITLSLPVGQLPQTFRLAQIDFLSLSPPIESFEVRAFINKRNANQNTSLEDPSFAGRLSFFGHGTCFGAPGHCNPDLAARDSYDLRPKHPLRYQKTRYSINITEALKRMAAKPNAETPLTVTLVTLNLNGDQVSPDVLEHEGVTLTTKS